MANPSRPFQSQVMTHLVKLYHRLTAKGTQWVRHGRSTTRWWTQVALYPAYIAAQATRSAFQKAQNVTTQWRDRLGLNPRRSQPSEAPSPLPTDWSIQQVLSVVLPPTAIASRELDTPAHSQPALWQGNDGAFWSIQQVLSAVLPPTAIASRELDTLAHSQPALWQGNDGALQLKSHQLPTGGQIQGLASCLENHALVLVGTDNQIVACLSADQQAAIATLISQLMAAYDRWQRQQHHLGLDQTGAVVSARTWWPVRFVAWLLAWMQSGMAHSSVNELSASESGEQLPPQTSLNGQPSDRSLPPQFWSQPLALLQEKLGDRPWIQQGLQAFQSIQSRLKSAGESLALCLPTVPSRLQLPPAQTNSGFMAPFNLGSWPRSSQALLQSLMPWLGSPTGQLTPVGSGEMAEALMSVSMTATGDAIAAPKTDDYSADWINSEVLTTEYLERPFRRLLRWLDQLLLWLEKKLVGCWEWLRSLFSSMR